MGHRGRGRGNGSPRGWGRRRRTARPPWHSRSPGPGASLSLMLAHFASSTSGARPWRSAGRPAMRVPSATTCSKPTLRPSVSLQPTSPRRTSIRPAKKPSGLPSLRMPRRAVPTGIRTHASRAGHIHPGPCVPYHRRTKADAERQAVDLPGVPRGTRTPVFAVRGRRPGPLDDGDQRWRRGLSGAGGSDQGVFGRWTRSKRAMSSISAAKRNWSIGRTSTSA